MKNYQSLYFTLFLILTFWFFGDIAYGQQYILTGKVVNQDKQAIEFVRVNLLKNDALHIGQAHANSLGNFSIKAEKGNYPMIFEQFGQKFFNKKAELNQDTDLGEIEIDNGTTLERLVIEDRKRIIEKVGDKLYFNVENIPLSIGNNRLDIFQKSPKIKRYP